MLQQRLIPIDDELHWQALITDIPHAPAHLHAYNRALWKTSKLETYLYCATAANFKAICPLSIREKHGKHDVVTPYGFGGLAIAGDYLNFDQAWQAFLVQQGFVCGYISIHPTLCQSTPFQPAVIHKNSDIYTLDLTPSLENLHAKLAKSHRYELNKWQNSRVKLILDQHRLEHALPELYSQTLKRIDASSVYNFSNETLCDLLNSEYAFAIGAEVDNTIEAISLFLFTPQIAEYFLNAASEAGRKHSRGLLWSAIEWLKNAGVPLLNLGGGIKPLDNLNDFKRRFGGEIHDYNVAKLIFDQATFDRLCQQTSANNLINVNYFPPYYHTK